MGNSKNGEVDSRNIETVIVKKNEKLNLQDIIDMVAFKQKITKEDAEIFVKEFFVLIQESLSVDNPVKIKDFGAFKLTLIQARESVNVNTGEKIEIPAHYRFSFSPATALKESVNKPFSIFETTLLYDELHNKDALLANEDENENEENDIIFVAEEKPFEKIEVVIEKSETLENNEQLVSEEKTQTIERKSPKKASFGKLLGIAAASIAIIAVGLLVQKK